MRETIEQMFRHVAEQKGLGFDIKVDPRVAPTISTDANRLQQSLKNLLSNAFKFTAVGSITLSIGPAGVGENEQIAFSVTDTGIGIQQEKQKLIFEAFQQADGTTSRKYGGTGLGLTISREIARLLGVFSSWEATERSSSRCAIASRAARWWSALSIACVARRATSSMSMRVSSSKRVALPHRIMRPAS
jgi:signal transduction histidine kinase